jgi:hypothetical protein
MGIEITALARFLNGARAVSRESCTSTRLFFLAVPQASGEIVPLLSRSLAFVRQLEPSIALGCFLRRRMSQIGI